MTRTDRQELIENWDQHAIDSARVAIAGDGLLGELTLLGMSAMGLGDIEYFCPADSTLLPREDIADIGRRINSDASILGLRLDASRNMRLLGSYDALIDATSNPGSKFALMEYCHAKSIPFISACADNQRGGIGLKRFERHESRLDIGHDELAKNLLFTDCRHDGPGIDTAGVIAGIAIEEARKIIAPIGPEPGLEDLVLYYPRSRPHFKRHEASSAEGPSAEGPSPNLDGARRLKIALVGAGALGNFCGMNLALSGIERLDIYDFDTIEDTNLNRQILFYERIGQAKAAVLKERLDRIVEGTGGRTRIRAYESRVAIDDIRRFGAYDAIIDCVDSFKTRALLNYISRHHGVPLISGGTNYQAGQAITCKDACLDCQFDINAKAKKSQEAEHCIYAPTPSVVTSNMIIGFMQGAQAKNLAWTGFPILKYVSTEQLRLAEIPARETCACTGDSLRPIVEALYR